MGTACLWGRTRELELRITAHMDSTRATQRRKRGKDLHRVHELHLPWACDGISTLELNVRQD